MNENNLEKWKRKGAAAMAALVLTASPTLGVLSRAAAESPTPAVENISARLKAEARTRLSLKTEAELLTEAGISGKQWAEMEDRAAKAPPADALTERALRAAEPKAALEKQDGRVYMLRGGTSLGPVRNAPEALKAACRLAPLMGGAGETALHLTERLEMPGMRTYVFQQVFEGRALSGNTLKLVTDEAGRVTAAFSSLNGELPEAKGVRLISAAEAEQLVRDHLADQRAADTVIPEMTGRILLSPDEEDEAEEGYPDHLVWMVFSANPDPAGIGERKLPCLAHFVDTQGNYLHSVPARRPGDPTARDGYDAESVFRGMETGTWRGIFYDEEGREELLEVPVMMDPRTGKCHLGDPERKIAVADFYGSVYEEGPGVKLLAQDISEGWDEEILRTYANMIRVWDYYAEKGWIGPDGRGTPMLLLAGMCLEDGTPIDNAAYMGLAEGWQCFCFGGETAFGRAVDVLAHEFVHCATTTAMGDNFYLGDWGAINEAMSDILGNLCEMQLGATDDTRWLLGENVGIPIRAMADPHLYGQPESVWDIYYAPEALLPNDMNDQGGVHSNSSLLSIVASRLCLEERMTLEEAEKLWFTVFCGLTATTGYPEMAPLLRWALEASGNGRYREALEARLAETRMESREIAETLPGDQMRLSLQLPDTEAMQDPNWVLMVYQVNTEKLGSLFLSTLKFLASLPDESILPEERARMLRSLIEEAGAGDFFGEDWRIALEGMDATLKKQEMLNSIFSQHTSWVSDETNRMEAVVMRQPCFCLLLNMDPDTGELRGMNLLAGEQWVDLMPPEEGFEYLTGLLGKLIPALPKLLAFPADGSSTLELPSAGLEALILPDPDSVG